MVRDMRKIAVDQTQVKGRFNRYAQFCVGAGRAGEGLRKTFQDQLEIARKDCGFQYLRFHGIFHEDMGVCRRDPDGQLVYNWQYVDILYDSLLEKGIRPFVELGFMPKVLASGEKTIFWWTSNVTLPADFQQWYDFIFAFVSHLEDRYGREEVLSWYFEIWNEPDIANFFLGTQQDYYNLYAVTAKAVKAVCKDYRVGGPASANPAWVKQMIDYCDENGLPIDFTTSHCYGVEGYYDDRNGKSKLYLREEKDFSIKTLQGVKQDVIDSGHPDMEVHYTEWGPSYSSRDPVHDAYLAAPYVLYHLKRLDGYLDSISYWTFTDIFEEICPPPTPFHGGFGLINTQGLKKPVYHAYHLLAQLGDTELECGDSDCFVCKNEAGVQLLLWNYTHPILSMDNPNQVYFKQEHVPQSSEAVCYELGGLTPSAEYRVKRIRVGYKSHDVYTDYLHMGSPDNLSREQVRELAVNNQLKAEEDGIMTASDEGCLQIAFDLRENDVVFVSVEKVS